MMVVSENAKKRKIIFAIAAALSIIYLDQTGVSLTLDAVQKSLLLTLSGMQWVMNAYLLTLAVFILLGGKLADIFGYRNVFLIGLSLFLMASFLCATANVAWCLILGRVFQGLGGSMLIPTSIALIAHNVNIHERGKMIGLTISIASAFLAFGPTIGGLLTDVWSWRLIYWLNIPIGLLSIFLIASTIKNDQPYVENKKLDFGGFLTLSISIASFVFAFMQMQISGWDSYFVYLLLASFVIFFMSFIFIECYVSNPFVDLKLFRNPLFLFGGLILFLLQICHISSAVFWVLFLQNVLGYSSGKAGLYILPVTIPVIFCARLSGQLYDHYGPKVPMLLGLFLSCVGVFLVMIFASQYHYFPLVVGFLLYGMGAPLVIPAAMTCILSSVSKDYYGLASGVANAMRQIGGSVGLSVVGAIIACSSNNQLNLFLSQASGVFRYWRREQIQLLLKQHLHIGVVNDQLSSQDLFILKGLFVKAYAHAFSVGMFFAFVAVFIALSMACFIFIKYPSKHSLVELKEKIELA